MQDPARHTRRTRRTQAAAGVVGLVAGVVGTSQPVAANTYLPSGCTTWAQPSWGNNCQVAANRINTGAYVTAVQSALRGNLAFTGCVDGTYDTGVQTAIQSFQTSQGLTADGNVGTNTWNALRGTLALRLEGIDGGVRFKVYSAGFDAPNVARFIESYTHPGNAFIEWGTRQPNACNAATPFKRMQNH